MAPGACGRGISCLSGAGQPRSAVWVGPSSIIGADASPTSAPLSPRPPAPPCKVTLGGERPAPPPLLPCLCPRVLGAFSVSSSPSRGWGQQGGPRRGRWRSGARATVVPCCEARQSPYLSGPVSSFGIPGLDTLRPVNGGDELCWRLSQTLLVLVPTPSPSAFGAWVQEAPWPYAPAPHEHVIQASLASCSWGPGSWALWKEAGRDRVTELPTGHSVP